MHQQIFNTHTVSLAKWSCAHGSLERTALRPTPRGTCFRMLQFSFVPWSRDTLRRQVLGRTLHPWPDGLAQRSPSDVRAERLEC